jgi:hypothetical protein
MAFLAVFVVSRICCGERGWSGHPCYVGPLSPQHGASSGCGSRSRPSDWRVAVNTLCVLNKKSRTSEIGGWA